MRVFVWLFQAPASDAAAIRSTVTTEARRREEWPHLVVPGVDGPDMNKLEKLARPKRAKGSSRLGGELLDRGKVTDTPFTAVSTMTPKFVAALAALDDPAAEAMGKAWAAQIEGVTEAHAAGLPANGWVRPHGLTDRFTCARTHPDVTKELRSRALPSPPRQE